MKRDSLTLETMRWKAISSSSILSLPLPHFLSAIRLNETLNQRIQKGNHQ